MKNPDRLKINRREMLGAGLATLAAPALSFASSSTPARASSPLIELTPQPTLVRVQGEESDQIRPMTRAGGRWAGSGVEVECVPAVRGFKVLLTAETVEVQRIHLRWSQKIDKASKVVGDAWERSYGDLAWLPLQPERALPWYFLASDGQRTFGAGVKTGAAAFAFWLVDAEGISLWLDVRNGGKGVRLGKRLMEMAHVVTVHGQDPWSSAQDLCAHMMEGRTVATHRGKYPVKAIYGCNDWYYAYGQNTAEGVLRDAALVRELAPATGPMPFAVIDDGYQDAKRFPSLPKLAEQIRSLNVAPGIWVRPTRAPRDAAASLLLPQDRWDNRDGELAYDPTIPEALQRILNVIREACDWGYDFIKHDFTTYELLGYWGSSMGASPTSSGWSFHDRSLTNAEIISHLYREIRKTAGEDRLILGCNAVGHLSAGIFDAQRSGDDVSGHTWERTRRMGVNTLAFRLPQHRRFFAVDADCVPITPDIPWQFTEAWLQAVAASGTVLLISPDPRAIGAEQKAAVRRAFAENARASQFKALDWMESRTPSSWETEAGRRQFQWLEEGGALPFSV